MRILVIGGGGREHTLVWKLAQSPQVSRLFCIPGNAGIAEQAQCVPLQPNQVAAIAAWATAERIDLTVVGPELPLSLGIVDEFTARGLSVFGPQAAAARIETSKVFAKNLLQKYGILTAFSQVFDDRVAARSYIRSQDRPLVVKADGLAAGKGVIVCPDPEAAAQAVRLIMEERAFGEAGERVIVEDYLEGEELSYLAFTDGETVLPMVASQDHKPIYDGDRGPNTGGMGAYAPVPWVTPELERQIMREIMVPVVQAMASEGCRYRGVLYAGLMMVEGKPYVLEFNARFGDPETQGVLPLLESDLVEVMQAVAEERLDTVKLEWKKGAALCVVVASGGYPGKYRKGVTIRGVAEAQALEDVVVFHAGTSLLDGKLVTAGGRVLGVVGYGEDLRSAQVQAYAGVEKINFPGMYYRRDIGRRALR